MPTPEVQEPQVHGRQPLAWYLMWLLCAPFAVFGLWYATEVGLGYDSHAYWAATQHLQQLYGAPALSRDAYLYSPLFAQVIWPLGRLPWPVFAFVWSAGLAAVFVWLLRPLAPRWFIPAFLAVLPEVVTGNIYALMAAALVLGVRSGPPWALLGLTKIVPGGIGVIWLSGTRQWRALATGLAATTALVGVSFALAPDAWKAWVTFLLFGSTPTENVIPIPWLGRTLLLVGVLLAVLAAAIRKPWLLAVSAVLMSPTIGFNTLTLLAAVPRLRRAAAPAERGVSADDLRGLRATSARVPRDDVGSAPGGDH